jgi:hypothetical protein
MSIGTLLVIILILVVVGGVPAWPYSRSWGYAPVGTLSAVLVVLLILALLGVI